jgi:hypothetical protein
LTATAPASTAAQSVQTHQVFKFPLLLQVHEDDISSGNWVARDGSCIDYSAIDAKAHYYHPAGKALFEKGDEPDAENYEGYTGNAGVLYVRLMFMMLSTMQDTTKVRQVHRQCRYVQRQVLDTFALFLLHSCCHTC